MSLGKIGLLLLGLAIWGDAHAQFSQPPPTKSAPVCGERKSTRDDCKRIPSGYPVSTSLTCHLSEGTLYCQALSWWYNGLEWVSIDPSTLRHDWAFIVDGQEYYEPPIYWNELDIPCGTNGRGYIRVSAASVEMIEYNCYGLPGG